MKVPIKLPDGLEIDKVQFSRAIEDFNFRAQTEPTFGGILDDVASTGRFDRPSYQVINLNLAEDGSLSATLKMLNTAQSGMIKTLSDSDVGVKYSLIIEGKLQTESDTDYRALSDLKIVSISVGLDNS